MRTLFPLFNSHLDLAHRYWEALVEPGDEVIDATCGNGHDTLKLVTLTAQQGKVYAFDNQKQAIESARRHIEENLSPELNARVEFHQRCHSSFPESIAVGSIRLIVYNLGYLPGGDKGRTTEVETTLASLDQALKLLCFGGVVSVTCYPGHEEGSKEEAAIQRYAAGLPPKEWSSCHHKWLNRDHSPSLMIIQKHGSLSLKS